MILKINDRFVNRKVEFFNDISMDLKFNSVGSTFNLAFYFDPFNEGHKELACVGHYHECNLYEFDQQILSGFILSQKFRMSKNHELTHISGYSKPGVLEDCTIPPRLMPLQSDGLSLIQIARKLIAPFKLELEVDPAVQSRASKVLSTSTASDSQTIKAYLSELAKQKNIILSHTLDGKLLLTEANLNKKPLFDFDLTGGSIPGLEFDFEFNGQNMHSDITVFGQASLDGGNAREAVIENPYVPVVYRPTTANQSSGDDNDSSLAARRALANELRNMKLTIKIDRWDVDGKLIQPNNLITIKAPNLYLYEKTTWFIESINFSANQIETTATLNCVLPEVYTNEIPVSFFKGLNLYPKPHV